MELQCGEPPFYIHIERNEFIYRKHKKQKEEDIAICVCQYDANDPDSACGDQCLNVLTSTECTPGYCPCGDNCKNQKFQNCAYAKARLFKTEGRGWGLLADEDIKAGQFVIEYCGEVISWKEAKRRSHLYETGGLKDAYIIYLNADESIDATQKGSLARFINHSCQPNCETRKWNVLGEIRVGIFAKQDIPAGAELSYDYNFEWYGGTKVRCLCGASCCSEFLGAKSRGFQESTYLWEDDDDRYSVENVPLYDSEDDEPTSKFLKAIVPVNSMPTVTSEDTNYLDSTACSQSEPMIVEPLNVLPMEVDESTKTEDSNKYSANAQGKYTPKNAMISKIKSTSACRNYLINSSPLPKTSHHPGGRSKANERKQIDTRHICERLVSRDAREEIFVCEEIRKDAVSELDALYDEIRPAIEEHERDSQDSVSTNLAEKWIEASCRKMKAEFDLSFAIIKSIASNPRKAQHSASSQAEGMQNEIKYLENGF